MATPNGEPEYKTGEESNPPPFPSVPEQKKKSTPRKRKPKATPEKPKQEPAPKPEQTETKNPQTQAPIPPTSTPTSNPNPNPTPPPVPQENQTPPREGEAPKHRGKTNPGKSTWGLVAIGIGALVWVLWPTPQPDPSEKVANWVESAAKPDPAAKTKFQESFVIAPPIATETEKDPETQILLDIFEHPTNTGIKFLLISPKNGGEPWLVETQNKELVRLIREGTVSPGTKLVIEANNNASPETLAKAKEKKAAAKKLVKINIKGQKQN